MNKRHRKIYYNSLRIFSKTANIRCVCIRQNASFQTMSLSCTNTNSNRL